MFKQVKYFVQDQICVAFIKIWPEGVVKWMKKLWQYYELIFFTFLPREIMNKIYELVPGLNELISHTLCKEDLVPGEEGMIYKDLTYLAYNRVSNLQLDQDEEQATQSEIMVIDILDGHTCSDQGGFGYLKGQSIDDNFTYPNLKYINDSLKQYRSGAYDQYIQESQQANDQNGSDE